MPFLIEHFTENPIQTNASILLTDSRFVAQPDKSIFFAIKGERHDGHQFIAELFEKGVKEFVVEKKQLSIINYQLSIINSTDSIKIWVVENAIKALQNLATSHRQKFNISVIGIVGSNGKTIVKEWLSSLLTVDYNIVKSPRSYNSQLGVALSVWQMNETHTLGIFEAGISKSGEMENLAPIVQPTIGIFTNIGSAHDEGFRSRKQKITEKLRLFLRSETLIYCKDYEEINEEITILLKAVNPKINLISWSKNKEESTAVQAIVHENTTTLLCNFLDKKHTFQVPFTDDASLENITHCIFTLLYLKISDEEINERLRLLKPVAMRLELKQGINNCYLIDDTYNNDLAGLIMALNFMSQQPKQRKVLVISDLLQSGLKENVLYQTISELIKSKEIEEIIGIGEVIFAHKSSIQNEVSTSNFYISTEDFLSNYPVQTLHDSLILLKGARKFEFEKIVNRLVQKVHGTVMEINLDALTNNLNFYRQKAGSSVKIMAMVKAFAYGSGSGEVASLLEYHRVNYLGVAYADEGVSLRKNGIKLPIMVMNSQAETFQKIIENNLEPEIYSFRILNEFLNYLQNNPPKELKNIHLKLDTGMHRLGFLATELDDLLQILQQNTQLKVASIFSHLVGADEVVHNDFSKIQIENFKIMADKIIKSLNYATPPLRHICNSAGIIRFPEAHFDMVRLGIGLYGVEVTGEEQDSLQTVGTLKTIISQIKHLKAGETVGYSRRGILEKNSKIATIAIGYADGFDRRFSKGIGEVLINNKRCPVIGNVCMDMTMIDVSGVDCEEGDEVIIFNKSLTIKELGEKTGTISYEILTGISERVKRVFYKE